MKHYDVVIAGGGPAGAVCAIICARANLNVLVLERAKFPRDKVCGDCLNPACWPVFERLGIDEAVRSLAHSTFHSVSIVTVGGKEFTFDLKASRFGEMGLRRKSLDELLLATARDSGATILEERPVQAVSPGWTIQSESEEFGANWLVAADGRNSSVARLLGLLPPTRKERIGLQTHFPLPRHFEGTVRMELLAEGYAGGASIGDGLWNLCLVAHPQSINAMKMKMSEKWQMPTDQVWRSITPLARNAVRPAHKKLLLVGDAARVVEPFTGEGIYYALRTGELAARSIIRARQEKTAEANYAREHRDLYRGRLWVNQLARTAVLHPMATSYWLEKLPIKTLLGLLTSKVTSPPNRRLCLD